MVWGTGRKRPWEVLPGQPAPKIVPVDPPNSSKRAVGMVSGGPKIITPLTDPPPNVDYFTPLPNALLPDLGKLARGLDYREKSF